MTTLRLGTRRSALATTQSTWVADRLRALGVHDARYARLVHPGIHVPDDCRIGAGSIPLAGVVLTADVAIGRHVQTAMALAPDGSVAGVSDVRVDYSDPAHGQVGITLVDPVHRGRRLGLALKVATHDLAVATYPELVSVDTSNAEVNTWMNAVNDALGYRTIETLLELQKTL